MRITRQALAAFKQFKAFKTSEELGRLCVIGNRARYLNDLNFLNGWNVLNLGGRGGKVR